MNLFDTEKLRNKLKDRKLYYIAKETGVSYPTLKRILTQRENNPSQETLLKLTKYFRNNS